MARLNAELELEVRNLYLFEGRNPAEIAEMVGEPAARISSIIFRRGLTKLRKEASAKALVNAAELVVDHKQRITEAMVAQSEQHALTALRKTGEALHVDDARNAASFSSTARNLVGIARTVSGAVEAAQQTQVNLFFVSAAQAEAKSVYADMLD